MFGYSRKNYGQENHSRSDHVEKDYDNGQIGNIGRNQKK